MKVKIEKSQLNGTVKAPPSKSYAHRALICAGLSYGKSHISNLDYSKDIEATLDCLESLGAKITKYENSVDILGIGINFENIKKYQGQELTFNCNECGSTYRFFIGLSSVLDAKATFKGSQTLISRPINVYEKIFEENNVEYKKNDTSLYLKGKISPGEYKVRGNVSSQFITGLLFSLPLLESDSEIIVEAPVESKSYIFMTIDILNKFGIKIDLDKNNKKEHKELDERKQNLYIGIEGKQSFKSFDYEIEGDYSNAAFFEALKYFYNIKISGLKEDSIQGDKAYLKYFDRIKNKDYPIDISNEPDLAPILFAFSSLYGGGKFIGTERLKIKESNRSQAMKEELYKYGVNVIINDNEVVINGKIKECQENKAELINQNNCQEIIIDSHNDHRIAMAMSVICLLFGGLIETAECVDKSFPGYWREIERLGGKITYEMDS